MVQHLYARSFMLMILGSLLSFGWVMAQEEPPDEPDDVEAVVPVFDLTDSDASEPAEPQEAVPVIPIPVLPTPHPTMTPIPPSELSSELFLDAVLASSTGADVTVDNVTDLIHEVNRATPFTKIIRLEPGTYVLPSGLTVNQRRLIIAGKGRGNPLTSTPDPATMAIIERDPAGSSLQLFRVMARGDLTLFNLVLRHGGGSQMGSGGALVIQSTAASRGKARLVQTRVTNSLVWGNGGGIYNEGGDLSVENSLFVHNEAGRGGAIANYQGSVRVTCTSFENNRVGDIGGAVHNGVNSSNFTITKSNFSNNVTQIWWEPPKGGAAYNHDSNAVGALQARGNWWGAPSGPPRSGRVNSVYRVDYANFRTTAVDIGRCPIPTDIFPLIAHAGEDQTVIDANYDGQETVHLDGNSSIGEILTFSWDIPTVGTFNGPSILVDLPIGEYTITLTTTGMSGVDTDMVVVVVEEGPWSLDGIVKIRLDDSIPEVQTDIECDRQRNDNDTRVPCSILAFNEYRIRLNDAMTWKQFMSLVLISEGRDLLLGSRSEDTVTFGIPNGVCWRRTGETWENGASECNVPTSLTAPGVQNDFVYAAWEWLFNECARHTGYNVNYEKNGVRYAGECNRAGFVAFLSQVQTLFQDTTFDKDVTLYEPVVETEFAKWGWHDGIQNRYRYGICPCTWGNVQYETIEIARANFAPTLYDGNPDNGEISIDNLVARRNDGRPYNGGWSFSYFDRGSGGDPRYRYFKVY